MKRRIKDRKVNYVLKNYLSKIRELFNPKFILLWGSRIYGKPTPYSDIDMIIVSDKFRNIKFIKRRSTFLKDTGLLYDPKAEVVDALCYSEDEFQKKRKSLGLINEALSKGIEIK